MIAKKSYKRDNQILHLDEIQTAQVKNECKNRMRKRDEDIDKFSKEFWDERVKTAKGRATKSFWWRFFHPVFDMDAKYEFEIGFNYIWVEVREEDVAFELFDREG